MAEFKIQASLCALHIAYSSMYALQPCSHIQYLKVQISKCTQLWHLLEKICEHITRLKTCVTVTIEQQFSLRMLVFHAECVCLKTVRVGGCCSREVYLCMQMRKGKGVAIDTNIILP